ncbi:MAG: hypothetical protein R3B57_07045 [Phycisphaerales bacterium]
MSESTPADLAGPASLDEIARLFLRGRDFDCPGCGYNRRDGAGATCAECGRALRIHVDTAERGRLRNGIILLLVAVVVTSVVDIAVYWTPPFGLEFAAWPISQLLQFHIWGLAVLGAVAAYWRASRRAKLSVGAPNSATWLRVIGSLILLKAIHLLVNQIWWTTFFF